MELLIAQITVLLFILNFSIGIFIKPKRTNYLFCGLFGYCGNEAPNLDKIKILGIYNDSRGGDSCGIALNDVVTKGIDKNAKFSDLIQAYDFQEPDDNFTVIGHTRKATHGSKSEKNAHPFEIYEDDHAADPKLIFAHNGQIKNWLELCKNYGVDTVDIYVDSLGIGTIISKNKENIKVLKEYKGYGAFLFYPVDKKNELYIFRGQSKENEYKKAEPERPLYYWKVKDKDQIYISSMTEALYAIGGGGEGNEVFEIECNKLILIRNGKFFSLKDKVANLDRSEVITDDYGYNYNYNKPSIGNAGRHSPASNFRSDENKGKETVKEGKESTSKEGKGNPTNLAIWSIGTGGKGKNHQIDSEPLDPIWSPQLYGSKVYFWRGRYYRNGHPVGNNNLGQVLFLDDEGFSDENPNYNPAKVDKYYFVNGYLARDEKSFDELIIEFSKPLDKSKCYNLVDSERGAYYKFASMYISKLIIGWIHTEGCIYGDAAYNGLMADGTFVPNFCNKRYKFDNGDFLSWEFIDEEKAKKIADKTLPILPPKFRNLSEVSARNAGKLNEYLSNSNIEKEMKDSIKADEVPFDYSVGNTEEPTKADLALNQTPSDEEHLDLFLDSMNNLEENYKLVKQDIGETKEGQSYQIYSKLKYAFAFLDAWYNEIPQSNSDDEAEEDEKTADEILKRKKKESKNIVLY